MRCQADSVPAPRTHSEYVYHFARGERPYFDLDAVRVPYKADAAEIARRALDSNGRRTTAAGFGRDRTKTYLHGGADPGNVVSVPQTYNQHRGVAHTAAMPEGLAEFFIRCASPKGGLVVDPSPAAAPPSSSHADMTGKPSVSSCTRTTPKRPGGASSPTRPTTPPSTCTP